MDDHMDLEAATQALQQVQKSQLKVIDAAADLVWYWWWIGGLMVCLAAAVDTGSRTAEGVGIFAFMFALALVIHFILLSTTRYNWLDPDGNAAKVSTADALTPMPASR